MRALLLSHSAWTYGAERALAERANSLADRGHAVCVVVPQPGPLLDLLSPLIDHIVAPVAPWAYVTAPEPLPRLRDTLRSALPTLYSATRWWTPDVVVTNTAIPLGGALLAQLMRVPHVWCLHELLTRTTEPLTFTTSPARAASWIGRLSARVVVPSSGVAAQIPATGKTEVIDPIDVSSLPTRRWAAPVDEFVMLGHRSPVKRIETLIRAIAELPESERRSVLLVGGEHPHYADDLDALAARLGVAPWIVKRTYAQDFWGGNHAGQALLTCSVDESYGRVVIEAMAAGLPVIAADSPAHRDLITNYVTGLLYDPEVPRSLADAMVRLSRDADLARALSSAAGAELSDRWVVDPSERFEASLLSARHRS